MSAGQFTLFQEEELAEGRHQGDEWTLGVADPPWPESGGGRRGAQMHYDLIKKKEDIRDTMLGSGVWAPAGNAHFYLWTTNTYLPWGLWLMAELGFDYKTTIVWVKLGKWSQAPRGSAANRRKVKALMQLIVEGDIPGAVSMCVRYGIGQYFRGAHELCLFGVRGKGFAVRSEERGLPGVIVAPLGRHSQKPEAFYKLAERRTTGPRVELFSRAIRPGWTTWGAEVPRAYGFTA